MARLRKLFGKRLRELRADKGYNQLYLATLASVSEDFVSLVERGINQPSFETIEALAEALENGRDDDVHVPRTDGGPQTSSGWSGEEGAEVGGEKLITGLTVTTDRLIAPKGPHEAIADVHLVIHVRVENPSSIFAGGRLV